MGQGYFKQGGTMISDVFEGWEESATKVCGICLEEKPLEAFGKDGGANYLRYECKSCAKKQAKIVAKLKKHAPAIPENYKCPICGRKEEEAKGNNPNKKGGWCADHEHKTGEFRGGVGHR